MLKYFPDSEGYATLIEAIEEYCTHRLNKSSLKVLSNQGLSVFLHFPEVRYASLYLLQEKTFEFAHQETVPKQYKKDMKGLYPILVENGTIGGALSTGSISYKHRRLALVDSHNFLIIPLLGGKGVIGIIILNISSAPEELNQSFFVLCNIYSHIFSSTLENSFLMQQVEVKKEVLDQQIATRTIDMAQSQRELSERFKSLQSQLSMSIPHEFRTPVNQIYGTSDFLKNHFTTLSESEIAEMLDDIHSSVDRLKTLTENYLYFANLSLISTNPYEIRSLQEKVSPSAEYLINEVADGRAFKYGRAGDIKYSVNDCPLLIGQEYFSKLILELVDNAMKYSEPGTEILIETSGEEGMFTLSVTDLGRGMSKKQIEQIGAYTQFERDQYEQQGSGLGLSIVVKIVDLHNGDFSIASELDNYTTVIIKLPVATDYKM